MAQYIVEMTGLAHEVYLVEADSPEEARANWAEGYLQIQESSSMEVISVREDN